MLSGEEISHPSVYIVFLNGKLQHLSFWFLYYPEIASLFLQNRENDVIRVMVIVAPKPVMHHIIGTITLGSHVFSHCVRQR